MLKNIKKITILVLCSSTFFTLYAQVKETHQIIEEWIKTKQLISEEKNNWKTEKSALLDLEKALNIEIVELEKKLLQFKKDNIGATKQRIDLNNRKAKVQSSSIDFYEGIQEVEKKIKASIKLLPSPLQDRLSIFYDIIESKNVKNLNLKKRLDANIGLLQSIHIFHRSVHLERQEFSLADDKPREFKVIYFGLGVAYFVNDSGNVSGIGKPSSNGWIWSRQDELAKEVSTGVAILENQALPRFLELPMAIEIE